VSRIAKDDAVFRQIDRKEARIKGRIGKDLRTWGGVFDKGTVMTLHRLLRNGALGSIDYPVSTGKEADVFHGTDGDGMPVAIKVYRVSTPTFQRVLQYIEGDSRFQNVPRDHRSLVHAWARKEYRNLERFREAGVDVPIPYLCSDNVIAMEYLGTDERPAATMKDEPPGDAQRAREKLWTDYRHLIERAKTIHADFSEYNCLMVDGAPRIIDCGQAVLSSHPMATEFLRRDVRNFARYFIRRGVNVNESELDEEAMRLLQANEPAEEDVQEGF
jgi:RIO kinase 1